MGLQTALVDRARCLRQVRTGSKVEGQPQLALEASSWFRCRVDTADTSERSDDGHWSRTARTYILTGTKDMDRQPLTILSSDYLQILSDDIDMGEDAIWQIDGDVAALRRRRGVIGYEFRVVQVREAPTWAQKMLNQLG